MTKLDKDGIVVVCNQCRKEYPASPKPQALSEAYSLCKVARTQGWLIRGLGFALCPDCTKVSKYSGEIK